MADKLVIKIDGDDSGFKKSLSGINGVAKKGISAISKGFAVASVAGVTAFTAVTTAAVKSYADYEQLAGGAKLMFGDAYDYIAEQASNAFATVQMSQNDYLKQVNGFATGLKGALNGNEQAAAELSHKIIQAEADVVAATGNTQENVQNAFNGIMKSNYTMLDNLQIGITPTKEGFQEMIDKVNEWNAANGKATNYQISNLADSQAALVDYIEMVGMKGYAEREAAGTLQGSAAMMKASWENLLTGMADPTQNFEQLLQNFITSVGTFAENLLPVIQTAAEGVLQMIQGLLPQIVTMISEMLPTVVEGVTGIINGIVEVLPQMVDAIVAVLPQIVTAIITMLPQILEVGIQILLCLIEGLTQALPQLIAMLPEIINTIVTMLIENLPLIIEAGVQLLMALVEGLAQAIPQMIGYLPTIIETIVNTLLQNLPMLIDCAIQLMFALINGLMQARGQLIAMAPQIIVTIVQTLVNNLPQMVNVGKTLITSVINGIKSMFSNLASIGRNIVEGIGNGISNATSWLCGKIRELCSNAKEAIKNFFGIHSPAKKMIPIGRYIVEGMAIGIRLASSTIKDAMSEINDTILRSDMERNLSKAKTRAEMEKIIDESNLNILENEREFLIQSQLLKDSELEADKERLEILEENADTEKEIYDSLIDYVTERKNDYIDKLEDIKDAQQDFADDLKTGLYRTVKTNWAVVDGEIVKSDNEVDHYKLTDWDETNKRARQYQETLSKNTERLKAMFGDDTESYKEILEEIRKDDKLLEAVSKASDDDLLKFVQGYQENKKIRQETAEESYGDNELTEIEKAFKDEFGDALPDTFFKLGEDSANNFKEKFIAGIRACVEEAQRIITQTMNTMFPTAAFAGVGGGNVNNNSYSATYIIQANEGESLNSTINKMQDYETYNKLSGGW